MRRSEILNKLIYILCITHIIFILLEELVWGLMFGLAAVVCIIIYKRMK